MITSSLLLQVPIPPVPPVPPMHVVYSGGEQIPGAVIPMLGIIFGTITCMVLGYPIIKAIIRRSERKYQVPAVPADITQRLERIEQAVEAIAIEVERVSEAQRFLTKLQSEARLPQGVPVDRA
ncbi:MAG: hypothetical protein JWO05_618 [Gemmatimonadetes bacterium]|nr:hypothetical protein [Gemmatimonadota bacterium]